MPTKRSRSMLLAAFLFYFFANQTQVGWMYVMSAVLTGTAVAAGWLNRGMLRGLAAERHVQTNPDGELYEGDSTMIRLTLRSTRRASAWQVTITESCPLAAPDQRERRLYAPSVSAAVTMQAAYDLSVYRRGLHEFPPLSVDSRAPFGFFRRHRALVVPTRLLVYPEVRSITRLNLLDDRLAPELTRLRAGYSAEVMGVRAFRSGDSPRHIHWRSTARRGALISKEFAEEGQPGLALALDLFHHPYPGTPDKHTPFEWMVKAAASLGDYAARRGYPLHLIADESVLPAPAGPVAWTALLQYLARVQPTGDQTMVNVLARPRLQTFFAALLPWPDPGVIGPLAALKQRDIGVLAVVIDAESFPAGGQSGRPLADDLRAAGIDVRLVRFGDDWAGQLQNSPV